MTSKNREEVFAFVRDRILEGLPPTVRDVQKEMGFSSSATAREYIDQLVEEGRLVRDPGVSRGLRLPTLPGLQRHIVQVPILGRVQAGAPQLTVEEPLGYIAVQSAHPARELFALKVRGDSMIGVGMMPGDVVVVRKQPDAENGKIVVALLGDDEATVKILKRPRGKVELHPANHSYPVLTSSRARPISILGVVLEVRRFLEEH